MENNNNNKSHFLDERGLQIYDQKIKEYIDNSIANGLVGNKVPTISFKLIDGNLYYYISYQN